MVEYVYCNFVVYCDLKLSNVFVCDDVSVVFLDFGVVKLFEEEVEGLMRM